MNLIIKWLLSALAVIITAYIVPGILIANFWTALWVALFLGIINAVIKPILILFTLPINILTLGFFTFVINALMVLLTSSIVKGFGVDGFLSALFFSIILSLVSYVLNSIKKSV
jgi:putative membrane protein